jgi:zona occludens toxin (predicted ATPase)
MARRKIGSDYGWILPLGVVALLGGVAYVLYQKFGGPSGAAANDKTINTANSDAAAASTAAAAAAGITPTMNANQAANIANQVYTTGVAASGPSDLSTIINNIDQVNNIADLNLVISAFGTKSIPSGNITSWTNMCLSLGINCTSVGLADFVRVVFAAYDPTGQYLETLNGYMSAQGINYTF